MNYRSTKFIQTSFVLGVSAFALFYGYLDALAYGTVTGVALANYAHHDVVQKRKEYSQGEK